MNSSHGKIIPDQCHRSDVKWDHRRKLFCSKEKHICTDTRSTMNTELKQKINSKYHITVETLNIHNKKNNNVSCRRKKHESHKKETNHSISWLLDQNLKSPKTLGLSSTSPRRP